MDTRNSRGQCCAVNDSEQSKESPGIDGMWHIHVQSCESVCACCDVSCSLAWAIEHSSNPHGS